MMIFNLVVLVIVTTLALSLPVKEKMPNAALGKAIVSQEMSEEDDIEKKEKELINMMEKQVFENTGLFIQPQKTPEGIPMKRPPVHPPDKNWARRMNEQQWRQKHTRLNPKAQDTLKRVMHNRNTINDNRHDKKAMKISRHVG